MPNLRISKPSLEDLTKKIDSASINTESKTILKFMIEATRTMFNDRDAKVTELVEKLEAEKLDKETKIAALNSELQIQLTANKNLSSQLTKMTDAHDNLEAYGRRESLVFSGDKIKPFEPNEDCVSIAKNMIQSMLKMPIDPLISTAHRMGKPPAPNSNLPDKRSIIVKFIKRDDKFQILKTARNNSTRVPGLFVNESLTPTRAKIFNVLRKCKNIGNGLVKGTSTMNGKIFVIHKPSPNAPDDADSLRTEINTKDKLANFCENFLKRPLETFLDAEGRRMFQ